MTVQVISLFPEMFEKVLGSSMLWKAEKSGAVTYRLINLRDFGLGNRKVVDDTPYGGGDGMLLRPEPLYAAVEQAKKVDPEATIILMTPRGRRFKQAIAQDLSNEGHGLIIICGRYEGYDERVTDIVDLQLSVGDYVLTGGEIPAMIIIDSVVRLLPGVLGGEKSAELESFSDASTLEHPHYTRPEDFRGKKVPDVLLSGNHAEIELWRKKHQLSVEPEDHS